MRVLMITSEWPTPQTPTRAPFIARQVDYLRRSGVDVDVLHFRGAKRPGNYLRAWRRARNRLGRGCYDLVHAQWGQSALLALPKRIPLVITFRGNDLEGIVGRDGHYTVLGRVQTVLSQLMIRCADELIVVSDSLARRLPPHRNYHVIPSGLDLELFQPLPQGEARRRLGLSQGKRLVLLVVGSLDDPRKRAGLARDAVSRLQAKLDAELLVVSGVEHQSIPLYMSACDALILTSIHEGSPNVVKEALACDLPVVSVDVGDVRERIGDVEGCAVCIEDSTEALAEALFHVLRRGARVAGRMAVRDLDERLVAERVVRVYEEAVRVKGRRMSRRTGFIGERRVGVG